MSEITLCLHFKLYYIIFIGNLCYLQRIRSVYWDYFLYSTTHFCLQKHQTSRIS